MKGNFIFVKFSIFLLLISFLPFLSPFRQVTTFSQTATYKEYKEQKQDQLEKRINSLAGEYWLGLFLHEAGHLLLVNHFHQQEQEDDFKAFQPKGLQAKLKVDKTVSSESDQKYNLNFTYSGAAFYLIKTKLRTSAKKFVEGFYRQQLIHLAGNVITKFFLVNKPKIISHLQSSNFNLTSDDDLQKAKKDDQTVRRHLSASDLKKFKWAEKIASDHVKKTIIKILLARKNWKIFQVLLQAMIIKKSLLGSKTTMLWNFTDQESKAIFENGQLPTSLKGKVLTKTSPDYLIWSKFTQWVKWIDKHYPNRQSLVNVAKPQNPRRLPKPTRVYVPFWAKKRAATSRHAYRTFPGRQFCWLGNMPKFC